MFCLVKTFCLLLLAYRTGFCKLQENPLTVQDPIIFVSTLSGSFYAVSKSSGKTLWHLKEDPVVKVPLDFKSGLSFLPDPKDGSLYAISSGLDGIKKLPFTIPELVTASPCRSADGILYTGNKKDQWIAVDLLTGHKTETLSMEGSQKVCPSSSDNLLYIGRTEYSIVMFDSKTRMKRWNATFMDYSSHVAKDAQEYDLRHFTASANGMIVTLNSKTGEIMWNRKYDSPVVAMYHIYQDGLQKIPFTSFAPETLGHLTGQLSETVWRNRFLDYGNSPEFYPTLYVGEHKYGPYALASFVDENTVTVAPKNQAPLLIEGPNPPENTQDGKGLHKDAVTDTTLSTRPGILVIGYHEVPDPSTWTFNPRPGITDKSEKIIKVDVPPARSDVANTSNGNRTTNLDEQGLLTYLRTFGVDFKFLTTVLLLIATIVAVVYYFPRKTEDSIKIMFQKQLEEQRQQQQLDRQKQQYVQTSLSPSGSITDLEEEKSV